MLSRLKLRARFDSNSGFWSAVIAGITEHVQCIFSDNGTYSSEHPPTDLNINLQDAPISMQDKADVVEPAGPHPLLKTEVVPQNKDYIAPELMHMNRELQGLSWVIKKPSSKEQTGESVLSHQETINSAASTGKNCTLLPFRPLSFICECSACEESVAIVL